jgi:hypothetical protein
MKIYGTRSFVEYFYYIMLHLNFIVPKLSDKILMKVNGKLSLALRRGKGVNHSSKGEWSVL